MNIEIRLAEKSDIEAILQLFEECVLTVCRNDYSPEQLTAWASASANIQRWIDKINRQYFIVAWVNHEMAGFGSLEGNDYIDFMYVHKDFQGLGVASRIFEKLVGRSTLQGAKLLKAEVSKTARHFFEGKGFKIVKEQSKEVNGSFLTNYQMTKDL